MGTGKISAGLRIDVDTLRGTRLGVPNLLRVLAYHQIKATFFLAVGPDNMGRHLRRLIHPAFLVKMLRSRAVSLYGLEILLRGTLWPGPIIGSRCGDVIRRVAEDGHEIGLHAWDHHRWQVKIGSMHDQTIRAELQQGLEMLEQLTGRPVSCSAAPGWRCTDTVLKTKEDFSFLYNSDCRGQTVFFPEVNGTKITTPQIPATLPTYDELIGRNGITEKNYNDHLVSLFSPDRLNVLTIHAEAEGIRCLDMFQDFLVKARQQSGIEFCPLDNLLPSDILIKRDPMKKGDVEGREGWLSCQTVASRNRS
jgi:undecaprenyl phosphate-alpha-L-ara4FN deformylase